MLTLETRDLPPITQRLMQLDSIYFAPDGVERDDADDELGLHRPAGALDPARPGDAAGRTWTWTGACRRGEPVRIRLVNERRSFHAMQHPIHLHGQRFLVLAVNGVPNEEPGLEGHRIAARGLRGGYSARSHPTPADGCCTAISPSTCRPG